MAFGKYVYVVNRPHGKQSTEAHTDALYMPSVQFPIKIPILTSTVESVGGVGSKGRSSFKMVATFPGTTLHCRSCFC